MQMDELQVFKTAKAWRRGACKLELCCTKSSKMGIFINNVLSRYLVYMRFRMQLSVEPKGDLERKIQAWIDAQPGGAM